MSKNKKITRKAFILKASKVACGYILLPITVSSLSNCDAIVKSEDCNSLDIYSECPCHGARFNIEGEVIKQPYIGSANSPLKKYISIFSGEALTIVDPDDEQSSFILNTKGLQLRPVLILLRVFVQLIFEFFATESGQEHASCS